MSPMEEGAWAMRKDITLGRQVTRDAQETTEETRSLAFAHRVLIATCIVAGVVLGLVFVWYAADLLMLVFAGILVSILLRGFSQFLTRNTGLGYGLSLALISLMLLALIAAGVWLIGDSVGSQISEIQQQLPRAVENLRPATRSSRAACNTCWRLWQSSSITHGDSIMGHGLCCGTSTRMPTSRWCS
jgi:hypothetical protein